MRKPVIICGEKKNKTNNLTSFIFYGIPGFSMQYYSIITNVKILCRVYLCRFVNSLVVGGEVKVAGAARGPAGHNY